MTDIERYGAIQRRDGAHDGDFFYGVVTTGVFCRPSCKSRQPLLKNIRFFSTADSASRAGFRACKRCHPTKFQDRLVDPIGKAAGIIAGQVRDQDADSLTLADLARLVGMSPWHFQRRFKKELGVSPREYIDALRLKRLKAELRRGGGVADAVYGAGYGSSSRVYERADTQLGMTPASYAKGGRGAVIRFTSAPCKLGYILVAATEKGLCMVSLGDHPATLEKTLRTEFSEAEIRKDKIALKAALKTCLGQIDGHADARPLALDIHATAFQWRVWRALRDIPRGETRTYGEIAATVGSPKAVRAVGTACASNPVALVIPCHRVFRSDGSLGGYRWGEKRKKSIVALEKSK